MIRYLDPKVAKKEAEFLLVCGVGRRQESASSRLS